MTKFDDNLKKPSLGIIGDGGDIALAGFIKNMTEVKEEIGDQILSISEFISIAEQFKSAWADYFKDEAGNHEK